jgi:hypothetical protein
MKDFPRSTRHLGKQSAYHYVTPSDWLFSPTVTVGDDTVPVTTRIIESRRLRVTRESWPIYEVGSVDDVLDAMTATLDEVRQDLRKQLIYRERVLEPDAEPLYELRIIASAYATAWPSVPGITGPDWELLEENVNLADFTSGLLAVMFDITSSRSLFDANPRRLVWAKHPTMSVPAVAREYFRFVDDERISSGHLRLAREV